MIQGLPASITGTVDPGDTLHHVTTTVTARPLDVAGGSAHTITVTTTGAGGTFAKLAAPANYQLTFTTPGYQTSTLLDTVGGGDKRIEAAITLGAAQGGSPGSWSAGTPPPPHPWAAPRSARPSTARRSAC